MPRQRRVLAHRKRRALTVHPAGASTPRTCAAPAGGRLSWPTRPPLLTTRLGGASNNRRTANRRPRPCSLVKPPTPGRRRPSLEQHRDRAPAPRCRHTAHPRPDRRLPQHVLHGRRARRGSSRRRPGATSPHSQTIRGLLGGGCAGWRVRPTSVELYETLRADSPTSRQRSIATVLINEPSFEDLVNAHAEGAFTWRQLARAAQRHGALPPLRIRQVNAFATPPPRPPPCPAGCGEEITRALVCALYGRQARG